MISPPLGEPASSEELRVIHFGQSVRTTQLRRALAAQGVTSTQVPLELSNVRVLARERRHVGVVIVDTYAPVVAIFLIAVARLLRYRVFINQFVPMREKYADDHLDITLGPAKIRVLTALETLLCWLAHDVIVDTAAHARLLARSTRRAPERFVVCLPSAFLEQAATGLAPSGGNEALEQRPSVLWFGYGHQRFHGVAAISDLVRELANRNDPPAIHLVSEAHRFPDLSDVSVIQHGLLPPDALLSLLNRCSVVLGTFGPGPKGDRVVPYKFLDAAAAGKPFVTAHPAAIVEHFGSGAVIAVPPDPDLACRALVKVLKDTELQERVGSGSRAAYLRAASPGVVAAELAIRLRSSAQRRGRPRLSR